MSPRITHILPHCLVIWVWSLSPLLGQKQPEDRPSVTFVAFAWSRAMPGTQ